MKLKFNGNLYTSTISSKTTRGVGFNKVAAFGKMRQNSFDSSVFAKDVAFDGEKFFGHPGKGAPNET